MDIKREDVIVESEKYDEKGQRLAPEEQKATHVMEITPTLRLSTGEVVGKLAQGGEVDICGTAAEFACAFRYRCALCKHFRQDLWHQLKAQWMNDPTKWAYLNEMRALLLSTGHASIPGGLPEGGDGDVDVENALNDFGICLPQTEIERDEVIVHPTGGCPTHSTSGEALPRMFVPRDDQAERDGNEVHDAILRAAQGTIPRFIGRKVEIKKSGE